MHGACSLLIIATSLALKKLGHLAAVQQLSGLHLLAGTPVDPGHVAADIGITQKRKNTQQRDISGKELQMTPELQD